MRGEVAAGAVRPAGTGLVRLTGCGCLGAGGALVLIVHGICRRWPAGFPARRPEQKNRDKFRRTKQPQLYTAWDKLELEEARYLKILRYRIAELEALRERVVKETYGSNLKSLMYEIAEEVINEPPEAAAVQLAVQQKVPPPPPLS